MKTGSDELTESLQGFLAERENDIYSMLNENSAYRSLRKHVSSLEDKVLEHFTGNSLYLVKQILAQIDLQSAIQNKHNYFTGLMDFCRLQNYFSEAFIDDELAKCSAHGIPMYFERKGGKS